MAELRAQNRETTASLEDLWLLNEELQAAREELSTANEELVAANEELSVRAAETARLGDDLTNVLASAGIPILLLDRGGRVRRFTPTAAKVFALIDTDVGRPFADIASRLRARTEDLVAAAVDVLSRRCPIEQLVEDVEGRWHQVALRPYLTGDGAVDGTVIAIVDIDPVKRREQAAEAQVVSYEDKLREMAFDATVAEERERRRIVVDLHDHVGQSLALLQIRLTTLRDSLPTDARGALVECIGMIEQSIVATRALIFELSPPVLYDLGLKAAVAWLAEQFALHHRLAVRVEGDDLVDLDSDAASILFRAVRELLTNVAKHAKSPRATVTLRREGDHVGIDVEDSGVGFDAASLRAHASRGFGLFSVREQIARLGGTLEIAAESGAGTRVSLRVPVAVKALPGSKGGEP